MSIRPEAIIYTDGSCLGNPGPGGWAAIVSCKGEQRRLSGGEARTTNNRMELLGVINGLESLRGPHIVTIKSDSQYIVNAFNKGWLTSWKKNGWKRTGGEVKNLDLWQKLDKLVERHSCSFQWVKGHAGNTYNEECDRLALSEAKKHAKGANFEGVELSAPETFENSSADKDAIELEERLRILKTRNKILFVALAEALKENNLFRTGEEKPCGTHSYCDYCEISDSELACAIALETEIRYSFGEGDSSRT